MSTATTGPSTEPYAIRKPAMVFMSNQGMVKSPMTPAIIPPVRKLTFLGARLATEFAGDMTFAAMFVEIVAMRIMLSIFRFAII